MPDDSRGDDLKAIWRNQPMETPAMTVKLIRSKARDLQAKTRRKLLGTLAGPVVAASFYAIGVRLFPGLEPVLRAPFLFALAWSLAGLYFLNRGMWRAALPGDFGLSTGLEFCREEIERRRSLLRRLLLWSLGPILFAIGTFIAGLATVATRERGLFPNGLPFLALLVIWVVAYFVMRAREQRELTREIDELSDLERDDGRP